MATYEQQTFLDSDPSLYSAQESRASRLVSPGSDEAKTMCVGSGRQLSMLLDQSSPLGAFSRILLESSVWATSMECCYAWQILDTRFDCSAFQLQRWEQDTSGTESLSLLPTPTVPNGGRVNPEGTSSTGKKPDGTKAQMDLHHAIKRELMPTPHANCSTGQGRQGRQGGDNLQTAVLSPTPRMEGFDAGGHRGNPDSLHAVAKLTLSPTPTTRDYKDGTAESCKNVPVNGLLGRSVHETSSRFVGSSSHLQSEQTTSQTASEVSGMLSPRFVEEYQGYPIDHTALKPLEMQSCHNAHIPSSKPSIKSKHVTKHKNKVDKG